MRDPNEALVLKLARIAEWACWGENEQMRREISHIICYAACALYGVPCDFVDCKGHPEGQYSE